MASSIFSDMLKSATASKIQLGSIEARKWFRKKAQEFTKINVTQFMRDNQDRYRTAVQPGSMYVFYYDPKHKDTLPYYDLVPLIFPLEVKRDYILGINLHYLPPTMRAKLMDALYKYVTSQKLSEKDKLQISYGILKASAEFPMVKPCIKKYLKGHIRSKFVKINPSEWDMALLLNIDKFQKKTRTQVWAESRKIASGRK